MIREYDLNKIKDLKRYLVRECEVDKEDLSAINELESELQVVKDKLREAVEEYKRIHEILCEGYEYYDDKSEEFLTKHQLNSEEGR